MPGGGGGGGGGGGYSSMLGGIHLVVFSLSLSLFLWLVMYAESFWEGTATQWICKDTSSLSGQYQSDSVKRNEKLKAKIALSPSALSVKVLSV